MSTRSNISTATWIVRIAFAVVFLANLQCALQFVLEPQNFTAAYEMQGVPGAAAIQGLGVTFLMWNATYPAYIANPRKFAVLGPIILVQQVIGLVGESTIYTQLGVPFLDGAAAGLGIGAASAAIATAPHALLAASTARFIVFDAAGLVIMALAYAVFRRARRK